MSIKVAIGTGMIISASAMAIRKIRIFVVVFILQPRLCKGIEEPRSKLRGMRSLLRFMVAIMGAATFFLCNNYVLSF